MIECYVHKVQLRIAYKVPVRESMDEAIYEGIIDSLTKNGFDPEQIVKTVQIEAKVKQDPGAGRLCL